MLRLSLTVAFLPGQTSEREESSGDDRLLTFSLSKRTDHGSGAVAFLASSPLLSSGPTFTVWVTGVGEDLASTVTEILSIHS
ncbi:hypothetical protein IE53DRAFT_166134 [Violaceomyces palustris]|uniref:Uncharacterized protein n=1 Tax=Violaceomyces palustris TaxID=1673888 RepID=A0ACD0NT75_9BASI|nr:hypothetical protein IE53DRAFT_166134 [Violaceomyces palustris]